MAKSKTEANIHTKRYVEAVFEKRLREEGFSCPDDKYLCWYRISASGIVNAIYFQSSWTNLPLMLNTHYGIFPLFTKPIYIPSVIGPGNIIDDVRFFYQPLVEDNPDVPMERIWYSSDILVYAPGRDGKGIFTFDGILLPKMNSITSIEECYQFHKQRRLDISFISYKTAADHFQCLPASFVDLAVWVDDEEVYPYCETSILKQVKIWMHKCAKFPDKKEFREELQHWEQLKTAILDGGREKYLKILEQRRLENIRFINKRLGISI